MKKIKIEVVERAGWWQVKVCGLRHSRYRSQAAARHGARRLAARLQKLSVQARSRAGRMQLGSACASRTASCTASGLCCEGGADQPPPPRRRSGTYATGLGYSRAAQDMSPRI